MRPRQTNRFIQLDTHGRNVMARAKSSYEDLQDNVRALKLPEIETWTNQYPGRDTVVRLSYPEFTCICPKTGLPDFAVINIEYIPDRTCVELKSLKCILSLTGMSVFFTNTWLTKFSMILWRLANRAGRGCRGWLIPAAESRPLPKRNICRRPLVPVDELECR